MTIKRIQNTKKIADRTEIKQIKTDLTNVNSVADIKALLLRILELLEK